MKFIHASDTHAYFPDLKGDFEFVVISGDFFPNSCFDPNRGKFQQEVKFQEKWMKKNIETFREWVQGKPVLWSSGNHDFFNPCEMLSSYGIEIIDLDNKVVEYKGLVWYGFPYVNYIRGDWNFEKEKPEMKNKIDQFIERLKQAKALDRLDVLVAHSPPYGVLDKSSRQYSGRSENIGNHFIVNAINYALQSKLKAYLCGHNHNMNAFVIIDDIFYSNAAVGIDGRPRLIQYLDGKFTEANSFNICNH